MFNSTHTTTGKLLLNGCQLPIRNRIFKIILPMLALFLSSQVSLGQNVVKFDLSVLTGGASNYGASPLTPTAFDANATIVGLTRGSGLGTTGTAAGKAWGGVTTNTVATEALGISSNNTATFSITANTGYKVSLTQIPAYNIRRSASGFTTGIWQYSVGGGAYTDIGSAITWGGTTTATGNTQAAISLSGISALQNVAAGTAISLRVVLWSSSGTGGTWYFNDQTSGTSDLIVTGTVTAVPSTYTVIYNGNGSTSGTAPVDPSSPYTAGSNVTVLGAGTLVKTGSTFAGWNTAANGTGTPYAANATISSIAANTTLYAQWTVNTYTVTYDGNTSDGGTAPVDPSSPYNSGTNVTVLGQGTLTKAGYTFNGWNTAANGSGSSFIAGGTISSIGANTILYAQWVIANSYAVTYLGNGNTSGTAPVDGSSPYTGGANVTVLGAGSLLKTGYTFAGWNTAANGSGTAYAVGSSITNISANATLYAQWTINTYTVTYNGNGNTGGTAPVDPSSPYNFNTNVTVLGVGTLTRTNYNFTGWNTAANGSGTPYAAGGTITGIAANTTLFAQWTIITYTVTYNGNTSTGGTAPVDPSSPYNAGSNVTVLGVGTLVKTGYTFTAWNTAANGSGTAYSAGGTISNLLANTVLFAQWSINSYTVTYDGNGNTGGTAPVDPSSPYAFGATVTVLTNSGSLTKTGSVFAGWNTAANGSGTDYAANGAATFVLGAANTVLYAKWAQPLYESFSYTVGDNIGGTAAGSTNNNWSNHSGTGAIGVTSGSLTYTGLQASAGNKVRLPGANGTVSSDVNRVFTAPGGTTVAYYSLLVNIADATQLNATGDYFAGFGATAGASVTTLFARLQAKSSGTGFQLGVTNNSGTGTSTTFYTTDLVFGTTYFVVVKHDFNGASNDITSLWVNPASLGGTEPAALVTNSGSATAVAGFASVFLRNSATTPKVDIDEYRAGTTWAAVTPPQTYQLTTTAGTGGTITAPATSPLTVNQGAATTITASANANFTFTGWTVESGTATIANAASISTTVTLNSVNATVKANFVSSNFTITATAQTTGGSISPSGAVTVTPGANQVFTITTDACNDIADLIVDGTTSVLGDMVGNTYTFNNVTANHTIDVYFNPSTSTTWTGNVNNDWNNAGNWTSCVPNATLDVIIPGTASLLPILNVDADVNSLSITGSASLVLNGKTLTINGGYSADPTASLIGSDASSLVLNSTNTLFSGGASPTIRLHNLTINGGTATLASPVEISGGTATVLPGTLSVQAGSQLESNGFLTIKSNAFGTGSVAQGDDAGNYITGDVTVERYVPANTFRSWRLLSVPTFGSGQTIRQAWQEGAANPLPLQNNLPGFGTQITGTGTLAAAQANGFDNTIQSASLLSWTGTAWAGVPSTNTSITTAAGKKGLFLYIRGERSQGVTNSSSSPSATTLRTKGQLYQGTQAIPAFTANSFNLVSNLYASAIDFTQLNRTGGVSNLFYIWDSKKLSGSSLGTYQTFSATNSFQCLISGGSYTLGAPNTKIESGQGFFVQTGATAGTITLNEGSKIANGGNLGFRPATSLVKLDTRLYSANSTEIADANVVVFDDSYSNDVTEEDAVKLANSTENFGIERGSKTIVIEGRKTISTADNINFNMWNMKQQDYKLEFAPQHLAAPGLTATLEDSYLHTSTVISLDEASTVNFTVNADEASKAANRFTIVFKKAAPAVTVKPGFVISPNPVEGKVLNLQFNNQPQGNYQVRLISTAGQAVFSSKLAHAGGSATQVLTLPAGLTAGMYQVQIIAADKTTTTQSLLVK